MANLSDIKLSSDDILKKQFKVKVKGYDSEEVDSYLDQVISDYDTFESIVEDLYGQIGKLQRELMEAKKGKESVSAPQDSSVDNDVKTYRPTRQQVNTENPQGTSHQEDSESSTNMAIIQRISTLERKVYNLEQHVYGLQK